MLIKEKKPREKKAGPKRKPKNYKNFNEKLNDKLKETITNLKMTANELKTFNNSVLQGRNNCNTKYDKILNDYDKYGKEYIVKNCYKN